MEHRLFYVDLDSWLDEKEFSNLVQSGKSMPMSATKHISRSPTIQNEMVISALEATARMFSNTAFRSNRFGMGIARR